jgi:hypothetical protein
MFRTIFEVGLYKTNFSFKGSSKCSSGLKSALIGKKTGGFGKFGKNQFILLPNVNIWYFIFNCVTCKLVLEPSKSEKLHVHLSLK